MTKWFLAGMGNVLSDDKQQQVLALDPECPSQVSLRRRRARILSVRTATVPISDGLRRAIN
jgi:hypothetical protein